MSPSDARAILETLVGFDTTSRNSNLVLIDWVEAYLSGLGARIERTASAGPSSQGAGRISQANQACRARW